MNILVTGALGQLGTEILRQIKNGGSAIGALPKDVLSAKATGVDLPDADLSSLAQTKALLKKHKPDVVINCAAFTNVDNCETQQQTAFAANAIAPRNLAIACEEISAKILHLSTDYVLSGEETTPSAEYVLPAPQSEYGRTKLFGEHYVQSFSSKWFIIRTAWLYGTNGNNFVKTILKAGKKNGSLKVVMDQMGNPTNAEDLAHHILQVVPTEEFGIYHCTGEGVCSWYDFAAEIISLGKINAKVSPCTTSEFNSPAKRPAYSALENAMLKATVGNNMRGWKEALEDYFAKNDVEELTK